MLYHISDDRQLNIRWIGNGDARSALASYQLDRLIGKDRERERTLVANHLNTVFLGTLMSHEAPTAARRNTTFEEETGRYRIFCIIKMRTVGRITMGTGDDSKEILQQVYLMRSQVVEISSTGNIRLQSPRHLLATLGVQITWRHRKTNLYIDDITYSTTFDNLLYFLKIRKITTVIGNKTWHPRLLADTVDTNTIAIACRQWFLDIYRFAGTHCHNGEGGMR